VYEFKLIVKNAAADHPTIYSKNITTTYSAGIAQIVVPINDIVSISGAPLVEANFNIQNNIIHSNPVASSITSLEVTESQNLVINFKAVESVTGTWQDLDDDVISHLFISIVLEDVV